MHELVGVVVGPEFIRATAQEAVAEALAPFEERWDDDTEEHSGWWDYWAIGGRWTGVWRPDYEAQDDPRNVDPRPCPICGGTGHRPDIGNANREEYIAWCGGCNGCQGKGHQVKWPTEWVPIEADVHVGADRDHRLRPALRQGRDAGVPSDVPRRGPGPDTDVQADVRWRDRR